MVHRFGRRPADGGPPVTEGVTALSAEELGLLLRDAQCLAKNWHPNIARIKHVDFVSGDLTIATELVDGATLGDLIAITAARRTPFPLDVLVRVLIDVLAGAHGIHALRDGRNLPIGAIHGALCPANIVVGRDGVARLVAPLRPRPLQVAAGSEAVGYAAPETLDGGAVDVRADVYAVGVILREVLTGRRLHDEREPARVLARQREVDIAPPSVAGADGAYAPLADIAMRALSFDRALRFRTATEMAAELRRLPAARIATGSVVAARVNELDGERVRGRRALLDPTSSGSRRRVSAPSIEAVQEKKAKPFDAAPPSKRITLPPPSSVASPAPPSASPSVVSSKATPSPSASAPVSLDASPVSESPISLDLEEVVSASAPPLPAVPRAGAGATASHASDPSPVSESPISLDLEEVVSTPAPPLPAVPRAGSAVGAPRPPAGAPRPGSDVAAQRPAPPLPRPGADVAAQRPSPAPRVSSAPTSSEPLVIDVSTESASERSDAPMPLAADLSRSTSSVVVEEALAAKQTHEALLALGSLPDVGATDSLEPADPTTDVEDAARPKKRRIGIVAIAAALLLSCVVVVVVVGLDPMGARTATHRTASSSETTVLSAPSVAEAASSPAPMGEIAPGDSGAASTTAVGASTGPVAADAPVAPSPSPSPESSVESPAAAGSAKRAPGPRPPRRYEPLGI